VDTLVQSHSLELSKVNTENAQKMKDLEEWCKMEIQAEVAVEKQCLKQEHQLEI
jgi:hypothetical protein|tara:strand:- start:364 stop:525 length:162 start_codon:yes stop_codon:yes gene_type:complete